MSKPIKNMIIESYKARFDDVEGGVVIDIRGVTSNANSELRGKLAEDKMKVTVVKNNLAKKAFTDTVMENLSEILKGPNALVYGKAADDVNPVNVARRLLDMIKKEGATLEFKGAIMDGTVFGPEEIEALSKYPTKEEAQAQVVQVVLGPASSIAGGLVGPANQIASILSTIEEKLENGETIAKVG